MQFASLRQKNMQLTISLPGAISDSRPGATPQHKNAGPSTRSVILLDDAPRSRALVSCRTILIRQCDPSHTDYLASVITCNQLHASTVNKKPLRGMPMA